MIINSIKAGIKNIKNDPEPLELMDMNASVASSIIGASAGFGAALGSGADIQSSLLGGMALGSVGGLIVIKGLVAAPSSVIKGIKGADYINKVDRLADMLNGKVLADEVVVGREDLEMHIMQAKKLKETNSFDGRHFIDFKAYKNKINELKENIIDVNTNTNNNTNTNTNRDIRALSIKSAKERIVARRNELKPNKISM